MAGDAVRPGPARRPGRARPAGDGRARRSRSVGPGEEVEVEVDDGRPARPAGRGRGRRWRWSTGRCCGSSTTRLPPIGPFFYDQTRTGAFATEVDEHVPLRSRRPCRCPRRSSRRPSGPRPWRPNAADAGKCCEDRRKQPGGRASSAELPRRRAAAPAPATRRRPACRAADRRHAADGRDRQAWTACGRRQECREQAGRTRPGSGSTSLGDCGSWREAAEARRSAREARRRPDATASASRDGGRRRQGRRPAAPRERFVETAYWNPAVVTGKDGKARVTFQAPMALSEYRFTARGVTGADTLVGQTTADLAVRKDFFVDLKVPAVAHPGGQAPVRRRRSTTSGVDGQVDAQADGLRRRPRAGLSRRRSTSRATASTRSCSSRSRSPTATSSA